MFDTGFIRGLAYAVVAFVITFIFSRIFNPLPSWDPLLFVIPGLVACLYWLIKFVEDAKKEQDKEK